MAIRVFHRDRPDLSMPMIARDARLVVWPGTGAWTAPMNYVDMQPGEENIPHAHTGAEDAIFVLDGKGTVDDVTNGTSLAFGAGQVVFVPPGVVHSVKGDRGVHVESVGGPAPADLELLRRLGIDLDAMS
jgi:quercetin dioxygenase-like cupin family protein